MLVGQSAGAGHHHTRSDVMGLHVVDEVGPLDRSDVSLWTQNCVAKSAMLVRSGVKKVEDHLVLVREDVVHLHKNRVTLAVDCCRVVARVQQNVAENVHCTTNVLGETARVVDSLLTTCVARNEYKKLHKTR